MISPIKSKAPNKWATSPAIVTVSVAIATILVLVSVASAQSAKGQQQQTNRVPTTSAAPAPSPVTQLRQQQQQGYRQPAATSTKRRPQQQQQQQIQQQQQQEQQGYGSESTATEDPLADSEPALYGSVAGKPGVDFPAYTRIPKTSFTCEGKGFDFGFYADEEAQCQVYHVCWSGRRESFLCGVGTVFNQAILACDYWHSVDCSKSSQFYGVNSELGKAGAEPASGSQRVQQPARSQATLPNSSGSSTSGANYGEPVNQRRVPQAPVMQQPQQQQQQTYSTDDSNFEATQQQQTQPIQQSSYGKTNNDNRQQVAQFPIDQQQQQPSRSYDYQQRIDTKSPAVQPQAQQQRAVATTLAPPAVKRPRVEINMDFQQKLNSLIDAPVRPPIQPPSTKSALPPRKAKTPAPAPVIQQQQIGTTKQEQQQQQPANFAQIAVQRARQSGSQRKGGASNNGYQTQAPPQVQQVQQQQQQQSYDADLDDQQQQQQSFDDNSPVQTSTSPYGASQQRATSAPIGAGVAPSFTPQQQLVIRSGGSGDGSSAITTQYDMTSPINSGDQQQQQQQQQYDSQSGGGLDELSAVNDDFRSAGAKAAASNNQNWYIMRSI